MGAVNKGLIKELAGRPVKDHHPRFAITGGPWHPKAGQVLLGISVLTVIGL
jgi:hypothetical protein